MDRCRTERFSQSPQDTEAFGEMLAGYLKPDSVIALSGGLGAGKTCLTKGIARGLGITENITSPTYTIINEYQVNGHKNLDNCPVYHIDAYRLEGDEDFDTTGAGECIGRGITIIEWSERIPRSIPSDVITIHIEISGPQSRILHIGGLDREFACC